MTRTSNDSPEVNAVLLLARALRWGMPDVRARAAASLRVWATTWKAHNWALVDLQLTAYGALENGALRYPLRCLAMAYDPSFNEDYASL